MLHLLSLGDNTTYLSLSQIRSLKLDSEGQFLDLGSASKSYRSFLFCGDAKLLVTEDRKNVCKLVLEAIKKPHIQNIVVTGTPGIGE